MFYLFFEKWDFPLFCTQITKMRDFRADVQRQKITWLCNSRSDFQPQKILKIRKTLKKKVIQISVPESFELKNYREKCRWGGGGGGGL